MARALAVALNVSVAAIIVAAGPWTQAWFGDPEAVSAARGILRHSTFDRGIFAGGQAALDRAGHQLVRQ